MVMKQRLPLPFVRAWLSRVYPSLEPTLGNRNCTFPLTKPNFRLRQNVKRLQNRKSVMSVPMPLYLCVSASSGSRGQSGSGFLLTMICSL